MTTLNSKPDTEKFYTSAIEALPLVSIICLCYNHEKYVEECLKSVVAQTYSNIEVLIMDDSSTDQSREVIERVKDEFAVPVTILKTDQNIGNTKAFNQALSYASGIYVIDLSTDDVLKEDRVAKQVAYFEQLPPSVGVIYSNASYINEDGSYAYDMYGLQDQMPEGNLYIALIKKFFIAAPTMMTRMSVLQALKGYDESLSYEDFDFWIRSSRNWEYKYQSECLTFIRNSPASLSRQRYKVHDRQVSSTAMVCAKIAKLNRTEEEDLALESRLRYEHRQAVFRSHKAGEQLFMTQLSERNAHSMNSIVLHHLMKFGFNLSKVFHLYESLLKRRHQRVRMYH